MHYFVFCIVVTSSRLRPPSIYRPTRQLHQLAYLAKMPTPEEIANAFTHIFLKCGDSCVKQDGLVCALVASKHDIFSQKTSDGLFLCDVVAKKLVTETSNWGGVGGDRKAALKEILFALQCVKATFFKPDENYRGGEWVRNEMPYHPQPSIQTIKYALNGGRQGYENSFDDIDWIADMFEIEPVDIEVEVENFLKRVANFKASGTNSRKKARGLQEASRLLDVVDCAPGDAPFRIPGDAPFRIPDVDTDSTQAPEEEGDPDAAQVPDDDE